VLGIDLAQRLTRSGSLDLSVAAAIELAVYFGGCLLLRAYFVPAPHERREWGLFVPAWHSLGLALLLGFTLHAPADFIQAHIERLFPLPEAVRVARAAALSPDKLVQRVSLMLAAAVLVPIAEEAFFRGALFVGVRRRSGASQAALVTAVCFTLSHAEPRIWPALSLVALTLSLARQWTGSLLPSILLHAAFNATTLIVTFSHPEALLEAPSPAVVWTVLGTALSLGLCFLLQRTAVEARGVR
jgi:membrane protease YdiL (CAAX protease family)